MAVKTESEREKAYCVSLYEAGLQFQYSAVVLNKLRSCYHICLKFFLVLNDVAVLPWFYSTWNCQVLIPLYISVQLSGTVRDSITVNEIVSYFNDILPNCETR